MKNTKKLSCRYATTSFSMKELKAGLAIILRAGCYRIELSVSNGETKVLSRFCINFLHSLVLSEIYF